MVRPRAISLFLPLLFLSASSMFLALGAQSAQRKMSLLNSTAPPPAPAEMRARRQKLIANQHADDEALNFYERIERHIDRSGGDNPRVTSDRTYRVVPTGGGTMKILLRDHGDGVSRAKYRHQLESWRDVLEMMTTPGDRKGEKARAKYEKRERQRAKFVDAARKAFVPKWLGRQKLAGRSCDVFELVPNPEFHPNSMFEGALSHVTGKIWVDRETDQLVRAQAWVTTDISFVAGIAGKVYRGSMVEMDQAEVAPGVWLPTHYEYDFTGRKFLFPFSQHETIEVRDYRRVGPPSEALALVKRELSSGKGPILDP